MSQGSSYTHGISHSSHVWSGEHCTSFAEQADLSNEVTSPHDSLAHSRSNNKSFGYFLQFDTPKSRKSRAQTRYTSSSKKLSEKKKKIRQSRSTPREFVPHNKENKPLSIARARSGSTSPPPIRRSSSIADSLRKFKELQEKRQELDSLDIQPTNSSGYVGHEITKEEDNSDVQSRTGLEEDKHCTTGMLEIDENFDVSSRDDNSEIISVSPVSSHNDYQTLTNLQDKALLKNCCLPKNSELINTSEHSQSSTVNSVRDNGKSNRELCSHEVYDVIDPKNVVLNNQSPVEARNNDLSFKLHYKNDLTSCIHDQHGNEMAAINGGLSGRPEDSCSSPYHSDSVSSITSGPTAPSMNSSDNSLQEAVVGSKIDDLGDVNRKYSKESDPEPFEIDFMVRRNLPYISRSELSTMNLMTSSVNGDDKLSSNVTSPQSDNGESDDANTVTTVTATSFASQSSSSQDSNSQEDSAVNLCLPSADDDKQIGEAENSTYNVSEVGLSPPESFGDVDTDERKSSVNAPSDTSDQIHDHSQSSPTLSVPPPAEYSPSSDDDIRSNDDADGPHPEEEINSLIQPQTCDVPSETISSDMRELPSEQIDTCSVSSDMESPVVPGGDLNADSLDESSPLFYVPLPHRCEVLATPESCNSSDILPPTGSPDIVNQKEKPADQNRADVDANGVDLERQKILDAEDKEPVCLLEVQKDEHVIENLIADELEVGQNLREFTEETLHDIDVKEPIFDYRESSETAYSSAESCDEPVISVSEQSQESGYVKEVDDVVEREEEEEKEEEEEAGGQEHDDDDDDMESNEGEATSNVEEEICASTSKQSPSAELSHCNRELPFESPIDREEVTSNKEKLHASSSQDGETTPESHDQPKSSTSAEEKVTQSNKAEDILVHYGVTFGKSAEDQADRSSSPGQFADSDSRGDSLAATSENTPVSETVSKANFDGVVNGEGPIHITDDYYRMRTTRRDNTAVYQQVLSDLTMDGASDKPDSVNVDGSTTSLVSDGPSVEEREKLRRADSQENGYQVEIIGGNQAPEEWNDLSDGKPLVSSSSSDHSIGAAEAEVLTDDNWKLVERDDTALEEDLNRDESALQPDVASEEDSMLTTPAGSVRDGANVNKPSKRISAPTSFPSNFNAVRSGGVTDRFTERMNTIEKLKSSKQKSTRLPAISATIGKFSSAFHRFESLKSQSQQEPVETTRTVNVRHSSLAASVSVNQVPTSARKASHSHDQTNGDVPNSVRNMPQSQPNVEDKPDAAKSPERPETVTDTLRSPTGRQARRSASIPLESSRFVKPLRESTNAPDVVPTAREELDKSLNESQTQSLRLSEAPVSGTVCNRPHFDIDIVIKREPLPDHINPGDVRELPTAAITLSKDEVKLMKLDPHRPPTPSDTPITVWDTEIPVRDEHERVLSPTKLHVAKLNKDLPAQSSSPGQGYLRLVSPIPKDDVTDSSRVGTKIVNPVVVRSGKSHDEPLSVTIRPHHEVSQSHPAPVRSRSQDDILSPKLRSSLALEPSVVPSPSRTSHVSRPSVSSHDRAVPRRRSPQMYQPELVNGAFHRPSPAHNQDNHAADDEHHWTSPEAEEPGRSLENLRDAGLVTGNRIHSSRRSDKPNTLQRQKPVPDESMNYTQKWVNESVSPKQKQTNEDGRPWYMAGSPRQRSGVDSPSQANSPHRRRMETRAPRVGTSGRSKSLGRKPCKAIADMTRYFQEEAMLSQVGMAGRPRSASPEDRRSSLVEEKIERHKAAPVQSRVVDRAPTREPEPDVVQRGKPAAQRPANHHSPARRSAPSSSSLERQGQRPDSYYSQNDERDGGDDPQTSPKAISGGIKHMISHYNKIDRSSKYNENRLDGEVYETQSVDRYAPRSRADKPVNHNRQHRGSYDILDSRRDLPTVREDGKRVERAYHHPPNESYRRKHPSKEKQLPRPTRHSDDYDDVSSQLLSEPSPRAYMHHDQAEGEVDDRPLTATAWKAWLGSKGSLEQKLESAYNRHMANGDVHRAEPIKIDHAPALRSQPTHTQETMVFPEKNVPLWKQQNKMAAVNRSPRDPVKAGVRSEESTQHIASVNVETQTIPLDKPTSQQVDQMSNSLNTFSPSHTRQNTFIEHPMNSPNHSGNIEYDSDYPPYANLQQPSIPAVNNEDNYAQIQKRRPISTENDQLLIRVPPPKPERISINQSDEQLHMNRRNMPNSFQNIPTSVTNQNYMDPYVRETYNPPQQIQEYNTQPHRSYNPTTYYPSQYEPPHNPYSPAYRSGSQYNMGAPPQQYRAEPQPHRTEQQSYRTDPVVDPNAMRPYHTIDPRYMQQYHRDPRDPRDHRPYKQPDPREYYGADRRGHDPHRPHAYNAHTYNPRTVHELRYNPRLDRVEAVDPRYRYPSQYHTAEVHHEPRPLSGQPADSTEQQQHHRGQRSKSLPNSKPSKRSDKSNKDKSKNSTHSKSKHKDKDKEKPGKSNASNVLPDFIPIHHVTPSYRPQVAQPYEYSNHGRVAYQSPPNRGRPGVGVMFNPDIGVTDF